MSSAALQAAPHQSTTITSLSPSSSPSRTYAAQPNQPREPYYNQQASVASPASTSRRSSRRPAGNGATPNTQQAAYYSPSAPVPTSSPMTSRSQQSSAQASPAPAGESTSHREYQRGVPPVAPPRTSSNQQRVSGTALSAALSASASAPERSRRGAEESGARMAASGDGTAAPDVPTYRSNGARQTNGVDRERDEGVAAATTSGRSKRRDAQGAVPQRTTSTREHRSVPAQSTQRNQEINNHAHAANGPIRETSDILNRLVISEPIEDLDRERERINESIPLPVISDERSGLSVVGSEGVEDGGRGAAQRSRQDHSSSSKREKNTRFGEYFLGNTLGEGEFGKVKMGWKQEGGVQVAIKLIRRDSVGTNPTRLAKIYREIAILREISHPNIVRLHEMVETEKHIGIILEYASGGELFDYILNHRYLKDNAARRLFAQLVSGVGYLHKKGIVHRDLKLENLLLDRNRNIIITDFGFANTFNPEDELGAEVEYGLSSREYVKKTELDKILPNGFRRGDLMQTSCGSPCYAAPELVVSDSLYTGRKVDVWSCGVILYAMLAGYLPFDDDPANPEGDNINLLYKYIVSTPLTFPEYVTPHARDLLRRILVPDPRKRADLFEVARHSWLSEYAHVVGFITSSTTTPGDIQNTTISDERSDGAPLLARSASVREPTKTSKAPAVGGLASKHGNIDPDTPDSHSKSVRDNKRNTIQLEYTEPRQQTVRGQDVPVPTSSSSRTRAGGPSAVDGAPAARRTASTEKPLPSAPVTSSRDLAYQSSKETKRPPVSANNRNITAPSRPGREPPQSASDTTFMSMGPSIARPNTGGSMASSGSMNLVQYSQPAAPTVAGTNAHGRISQPTNGKNYISNPVPHDQHDSGYGRPSVSQAPSKFARISGMDSNSQPEIRSHKRSSTVSSMGEKLFGRHMSLFGRPNQEKPKRSYPPVSLSNANIGGGDSSRQSIDSSRRSISFGFGKKRSGSITGSTGGSTQEKSTRRFSLIPSGFSLKAIGIGKDEEPAPVHMNDDRYYEQGDDAAYSEPPKSNPKIRPATTGRDSPLQQTHAARATPPQHQRYASQSQSQGYDGSSGSEYARNYRPSHAQTSQPEKEQYYANQPPTQQAQSATQYTQYNDYEPEDRRQTQNNAASRAARGGVLQKPNRRFTEAYEQEGENAFGGNVVNTSGSTGAARKVMDFFRRRGRAREEA